MPVIIRSRIDLNTVDTDHVAEWLAGVRGIAKLVVLPINLRGVGVLLAGIFTLLCVSDVADVIGLHKTIGHVVVTVERIVGVGFRITLEIGIGRRQRATKQFTLQFQRILSPLVIVPVWEQTHYLQIAH